MRVHQMLGGVGLLIALVFVHHMQSSMLHNEEQELKQQYDALQVKSAKAHAAQTKQLSGARGFFTNASELRRLEGFALLLNGQKSNGLM